MYKNIQKNPNCITTSIEDKLIILEFNSGIYFELNHIGMIIWDLIDEYNTSDQIINNLRSKFNNSSDINDSVKLFLQNCKDRKLISFDV